MTPSDVASAQTATQARSSQNREFDLPGGIHGRGGADEDGPDTSVFHYDMPDIAGEDDIRTWFIACPTPGEPTESLVPSRTWITNKTIQSAQAGLHVSISHGAYLRAGRIGSHPLGCIRSSAVITTSMILLRRCSQVFWLANRTRADVSSWLVS